MEIILGDLVSSVFKPLSDRPGLEHDD